MVYHGKSLMNQWRCLNSPTTGGLSKPDFPFSRKDGPQIISKVARCGMVWRIEKTISRPPFHGKIYHKKKLTMYRGYVAAFCKSWIAGAGFCKCIHKCAAYNICFTHADMSIHVYAFLHRVHLQVVRALGHLPEKWLLHVSHLFTSQAVKPDICPSSNQA